MSNRMMCPWCGASNRDNRKVCWACDKSLVDGPEPELDDSATECDLTTVEPVPQLEPDEACGSSPPWLIRTVGAATEQKAPEPITAFGSSCWLYGLWIVGISSIGQLGDAARRLHTDDTTGAITELVIPIAFLGLATALQVSRDRQKGKLGVWSWTNFVPAVGVIGIAIWILAAGGSMSSPSYATTDGAHAGLPERITTWESVSPEGLDCTVEMPGQPAEAPPQSPVPDGETYRAYKLTTGSEVFGISIATFPKNTVGSLDEVAGRLAAGMSAATGSMVRDQHSTTFGGRPAREFTIDDHSDNGTAIVRLYIVGDRVYQLTYEGPIMHPNVSNADAYFDTFRIGVK